METRPCARLLLHCTCRADTLFHMLVMSQDGLHFADMRFTGDLSDGGAEAQSGSPEEGPVLYLAMLPPHLGQKVWP